MWNGHQVPNPKVRTVPQNHCFQPLKHGPNSPNTAPARKNDFRHNHVDQPWTLLHKTDMGRRKSRPLMQTLPGLYRPPSDLVWTHCFRQNLPNTVAPKTATNKCENLPFDTSLHVLPRKRLVRFFFSQRWALPGLSDLEMFRHGEGMFALQDFQLDCTRPFQTKETWYTAGMYTDDASAS